MQRVELPAHPLLPSVADFAVVALNKVLDRILLLVYLLLLDLVDGKEHYSASCQTLLKLLLVNRPSTFCMLGSL